MQTAFDAYDDAYTAHQGQSVMAHAESVLTVVGGLVKHFDLSLSCPASEIKRVMTGNTASANKLPLVLKKRF